MPKGKYVTPGPMLLPWTYPWPKRLLCWLIWRCPVLRLPARALCPKRNPYRKVVMPVYRR